MMVKTLLLKCVPLSLPIVVASFYWCLPFRLLLVPFFKASFSSLNFYCYVYRSDPTSNRTTTTKFIFVGFESLASTGKLFWDIFSACATTAKNEKIKILGTLLSQTIFISCFQIISQLELTALELRI